MSIYLREGQVGLAGGDEWIQKQIRRFTTRPERDLTPYSHSFTLLDGPSGTLCALETTESRVTLTPVENKLKEKNWVDIWEPIADPVDKRNAATTSFQLNSGRFYGHLSYLWFMYRWGMWKLDKDPQIMWSWAHNGITCTELTCDYIQRINPDFHALFVGKDLNTIAPPDLEDIMKANPTMFIYIGRYVN